MPGLIHLQLLLATYAGWVNRHHAAVIDYLVEENRVLKEQLRGRRLRLSDSQRRRLAAKGKALGGRLLARIVTPDHRPQMATVREGLRPKLTWPVCGRRGGLVGRGSWRLTRSRSIRIA